MTGDRPQRIIDVRGRRGGYRQIGIFNASVLSLVLLPASALLATACLISIAYLEISGLGLFFWGGFAFLSSWVLPLIGLAFVMRTAKRVRRAKGRVCVRCMHPIDIEQHRRDDPCPECGEPNSNSMPDMWRRAIGRWGSNTW